jgi:SpoVK/Ycf46/Vps4 family AAA+-type ATPase
LESVAEKCSQNLTGADLYALCADAMLGAIRRSIAAIEDGNIFKDLVLLFIDLGGFSLYIVSHFPFSQCLFKYTDAITHTQIQNKLTLSLFYLGRFVSSVL